MQEEQKKIAVWDGFSLQVPQPLGTLYANNVRGTENYGFEFNAAWLKGKTLSAPLDPELEYFAGKQYAAKALLFGMFSDACPDRWGRTLMDKRERLTAQEEKRRPRKLFESDYLLGVDDKTRMGGLRFETKPDEPFQWDAKDSPIPPWISLRHLQQASQAVERNDPDLGLWLDQLIRPGTSLGGARPKATVVDTEGNLWIAKFPCVRDQNNIGAWEKIAQDLATLCELKVPESKLEQFSSDGCTFLSKRFDRNGERRIHTASAMTLLGKKDGASQNDGTSYLDIAAFIKANGASPKEDLFELWKRIVFSMSINNTDDHLRNHAFILTDKGWRLSPLYDVNPVPYGNELSLLVDDYNNVISFDLALQVAPHFGLTKSKAQQEICNINAIVKNHWQVLAKHYDVSRQEIEAMRPAFSVDIMK